MGLEIQLRQLSHSFHCDLKCISSIKNSRSRGITLGVSTQFGYTNKFISTLLPERITWNWRMEFEFEFQINCKLKLNLEFQLKSIWFTEFEMGLKKMNYRFYSTVWLLLLLRRQSDNCEEKKGAKGNRNQMQFQLAFLFGFTFECFL